MPRRTLSKQEADYRLKRFHLMAPWYGLALVIVAVTLPLGVVMWLMQPFAGKNTAFTLSIGVSFSLVANVAMVGAYRRKVRAMSEQSAEMNRLRGRVDQLERQRGSSAPRQGRP